MAAAAGSSIVGTALALISAAALVACGDDSQASGGHLTVTQTFAPAEPIAMEGSAAALTVTQGGDVVTRARTDRSQVGEPEVLFDGQLDAGTYELEVAHHACYSTPTSCFTPGERGFLRCVGEVVIREGEMAEQTVIVSSRFLAQKRSTCSIAEA